MDISKILSHCDHTLLAVDATWEQIKQVCDDGIHFSTASVCIPASYVAKAKEYVGTQTALWGITAGYAPSLASRTGIRPQPSKPLRPPTQSRTARTR